jgi:hypothetical protein
MLGAYGILPESPRLDRAIMEKTLEHVLNHWDWSDTWGWDYPMMELIDRDKELARLNKELTKAEKELGTVKGDNERLREILRKMRVEESPAEKTESLTHRIEAALKPDSDDKSSTKMDAKALRALRDEPGYWWNTYKRAWKQNWRQSLVPGALLGLFVGSWAWMLRAQAESGNTSTALWVASFAGIFVCTGFFTWLLAQVPLVDLPLAQIAKNAGLMFFGFFPRTAAAALVLALYWGATLLYLPATILTILAFGFWLPVTIALMIVYPGLEKVFKLEETINARRAAEIEERMAQNQPKFGQ